MKEINISPPTSDDISIEKAAEMVADKLYMFLRWILEGDKGNNSISFARENTDNEELNREILSVAQDIIYISSDGLKDTPKYVGLAVSLRHLTGSKSAIQLLNHHGHLCGSDKVSRIDTSIASDQISRLEDDVVIIPSNIRFDTFIQAAADNTDLSEETLDGKKTTQGSTFVLYQCKSENEGTFANLNLNRDTKEVIQKSRLRSIETVTHLQALTEITAIKRRSFS